MSAAPAADSARVQGAYASLRAAMARTIVGQDEVMRLVFTTLLCSGHSLLEGVPGVGKTLIVRTLARLLDVGFGRIQFTPDLMPSDILGTPILDPREGRPHFRPGPLFTDVLLADEINRASAKTQAALLEAMQERSATVDGTSHALGPFFTVFATQNPVEHEGTYPLPEAELDRFLFKIVVSYPAEADEVALLALHHVHGAGDGAVAPLLQRGDLTACREAAGAVIVRDEIVRYAAALVRATRANVNFSLGASPRAGVMLLRAAKANACIEGRDYAIPEDVQEMWLPTLRHRVQLHPAAEVEGLVVDQALEAALAGVTVPR
ncbi:MAG TPA: MoxR family ATPase [Myxococcota bacterium]|nr:MoxR family ATPase [Myxococcota bacterium]